MLHFIHEKYSCFDINAYLRSCVKTTDEEELKDLLKQFSENLLSYEEETGHFKYPSMGDGQIDYKAISNAITDNIRNRIDRHLSI